MEWKNDPINPIGENKRDSCMAHGCWIRNNSDGPCGIRICGGRYCFLDY